MSRGTSPELSHLHLANITQKNKCDQTVSLLGRCGRDCSTDTCLHGASNNVCGTVCGYTSDTRIKECMFVDQPARLASELLSSTTTSTESHRSTSIKSHYHHTSHQETSVHKSKPTLRALQTASTHIAPIGGPSHLEPLVLSHQSTYSLRAREAVTQTTSGCLKPTNDPLNSNFILQPPFFNRPAHCKDTCDKYYSSCLQVGSLASYSISTKYGQTLILL